MGELILITGGVRSGKSRYAEQLAAELGGDKVLYIATAEPGDDEMRRKIEVHRASRPATWPTVEAPLGVGPAIAHAGESPGTPRVILVDCLTLLASNLLLNGPEEEASARVAGETEAIRQACQVFPGHVIAVTNEVGWGVVPSSTLGRRYRDLLGTMNQTLAATASRVFLVVSGLAIDCKALASNPKSFHCTS